MADKTGVGGAKAPHRSPERSRGQAAKRALLAGSLRENLKRRKAQARGRAGPVADDGDKSGG
jgi:hypothetical protein